MRIAVCSHSQKAVTAREMLADMVKNGDVPCRDGESLVRERVRERGLERLTTRDQLLDACRAAVESHPKEAQQVRDGNARVLQRPRLVGDDSGWRRRCDLDILPRQWRVTRVALLLLWKLGWWCAGRCVGCVGLVYRVVVRGCRERVSPRWWGHG